MINYEIAGRTNATTGQMPLFELNKFAILLIQPIPILLEWNSSNIRHFRVENG